MIDSAKSIVSRFEKLVDGAVLGNVALDKERSVRRAAPTEFSSNVFSGRSVEVAEDSDPAEGMNLTDRCQANTARSSGYYHYFTFEVGLCFGGVGKELRHDGQYFWPYYAEYRGM